MNCPDFITLRYYRATPNVPYISVIAYYEEFFITTLHVSGTRHSRSYYLPSGSYFAFDYTDDVFTSNNLAAFSNHPDFLSSNTKVFIENGTLANEVQPEIGTIDLAKYSIDVYFEDGEIMRQYMNGVNPCKSYVSYGDIVADDWGIYNED